MTTFQSYVINYRSPYSSRLVRDTKKAKVGKYQWNVADVVRSGGHAASLEGQKKQKREERRDIIIVRFS